MPHLDADFPLDFTTLDKGLVDLLHNIHPAWGGWNQEGKVFPLKRARDRSDGRWVITYTLDDTEVNPECKQYIKENSQVSKIPQEKIDELNRLIKHMERVCNIKWIEVDEKDQNARRDAHLAIHMADLALPLIRDRNGNVVATTAITVQYNDRGEGRKTVFLDRALSNPTSLTHEVDGHAAAGFADVNKLPDNKSTWQQTMMAFDDLTGKTFGITADDERGWILVFGPAPAKTYDIATQGVFDTYKPAGQPGQSITRIFAQSADGSGVTIDNIGAIHSPVLEIHTEKPERVTVKVAHMLTGAEHTEHAIVVVPDNDRNDGLLTARMTQDEYKSAHILVGKDANGEYASVQIKDGKGREHRLSTRNPLDIDIVDGTGKLIASKSGKEAMAEKAAEASKSSAVSPPVGHAAPDASVALVTAPGRLPMGNRGMGGRGNPNLSTMSRKVNR